MCAALAVGTGAAHAFTFFDVVKQARALSGERYTPPPENIPAELASLPFGQYREIQQRPEDFLWQHPRMPFLVKLNHPGMQFRAPVKINAVDAQGIHTLKFDPNTFDYGSLNLDRNAFNDLDFAGFRVLYPLNSPEKRDDELASFLGASYFRMLGTGQVYGTSARGLAIDTALPSGEAFPWFREFWLARPSVTDPFMTVYALLDSPGYTGAYRFIIRPGEDTVVEVSARLFARESVGKLGLAPLTSMFLYGSQQPAAGPVLRPQLHDAEGLAIHLASGEWLWRPLNNPRRLTVSRFDAPDVRGFGLMQRARDFDRYQDLDDHYELRPGVWIEPEGDWGPGAVELVEIPTADETNDNIVAFWSPETPPAPGEALQLNYKLHWTLRDTTFMDPTLAYVSQTRRYPGEVRGDDLVRGSDGTVGLLIDFDGGQLAELPPDAHVTAEVWTSDAATIESQVLRPIPSSHGYRLDLHLKVLDATKPAELRAALYLDGQRLSETWNYQLPADEKARK